MRPMDIIYLAFLFSKTWYLELKYQILPNKQLYHAELIIIFIIFFIVFEVVAENIRIAWYCWKNFIQNFDVILNLIFIFSN